MIVVESEKASDVGCRKEVRKDGGGSGFVVRGTRRMTQPLGTSVRSVTIKIDRAGSGENVLRNAQN